MQNNEATNNGTAELLKAMVQTLPEVQAAAASLREDNFLRFLENNWTRLVREFQMRSMGLG